MISFRLKWHSLLKAAAEGGRRLDFQKKLKNVTRQAAQKVMSAEKARLSWVLMERRMCCVMGSFWRVG